MNLVFLVNVVYIGPLVVVGVMESVYSLLWLAVGLNSLVVVRIFVFVNS